MRHRMASSLIVAAFAFTAPAAAKESSQDNGDEIVVTGRANQKREVRDFVKALDQAAPVDPLGRFDWAPACPVAVGLGERQDAAITARMRQVAEAAGIDLAPPGCRANALAIVAPDKKEMIEALKKAHPIYFRDANDRPVNVKVERGPATAWHLEGKIDRSGVPVGTDPETGYNVISTPITPSRISATMRPVILASVVVMERDALVGLTTTQVADYAAMRLLARTDPSRLKGHADTILTVLDAPMDAEIPSTLTQWDLSYLKGLYEVVPTRYSGQQRRAIQEKINRDLKAASEGE